LVVVPDAPQTPAAHAGGDSPRFMRVLCDPQLARLNFGIFVLHAVLMAQFIVVPLALRDSGLAVDHHWQIYLPVMLGSFALMLPAILVGERRGHGKAVFIGAVGLLLLGQLSMPWLLASSARIIGFLLIFFTAFNTLEAMLPSLISKLASPGARGTAIGIYSSIQFFGAFVGAASGGFLYQKFGARGVFAFDGLLLLAWLISSAGMVVPGRVRTRVFTLPVLDGERTRALLSQLAAQPGVREVRLAGGAAHLKVDAAGFDEQRVMRLIAELA
jgi:predicted MFS family arabinose efflux permease